MGSELPYNSNNNLVSYADVLSILSEYLDNPVINDINIYRKAFVHRSYCTRKNENFINGNSSCPSDCLPLQEESNERLEFLGDAIVNLTVGRYLYDRYPDENEGFMTKIRTKLVNGTMLSNFASIIRLDRFIMISKQIEENEGRTSTKIMEDVFEAFVGAMLNDVKDYAVVEEWLINLIEGNIDFSELIRKNTNYKDSLIKHFQYNHNMCPKFYEMSVETTSSGCKKYTICVKGVDDEILGIGSGASKKYAENDASCVVLRSLGILVE
jgi:ribonuclease-3